MSDTTGVVGEESTTRNYNMEITFKAWIVCCPLIIKKHRTRKSRLVPWSHFQNFSWIVRIRMNSKNWTMLIDVMKHQNLMFDFVLMCITQWAVQKSPKRRQKFIHKNLYPFNRLVSKGEAIKEFTPNWFIDMLAFNFVKELGIFLHDEVVNCLLQVFTHYGYLIWTSKW